MSDHMSTLLGDPGPGPGFSKDKPLKHTCKDCVKFGTNACGATSPDGFCINIQTKKAPLSARPSVKNALIKDLIRFQNHIVFFVDQDEFPEQIARDIQEATESWATLINRLKDKKEFASLEEALGGK